jgi:hypothetical protein
MRSLRRRLAPRACSSYASTRPSQLVKGAGIPKTLMVTWPAARDRAVRARRISHERREWARWARERGAFAAACSPRCVDVARAACRRAGALSDSNPARTAVRDQRRADATAHLSGRGFKVSLPCHWHCSRRGQGRQLRMLAAYTTRRLPSASRRRS